MGRNSEIHLSFLFTWTHTNTQACHLPFIPVYLTALFDEVRQCLSPPCHSGFFYTLSLSLSFLSLSLTFSLSHRICVCIPLHLQRAQVFKFVQLRPSPVSICVNITSMGRKRFGRGRRRLTHLLVCLFFHFFKKSRWFPFYQRVRSLRETAAAVISWSLVTMTGLRAGGGACCGFI